MKKMIFCVAALLAAAGFSQNEKSLVDFGAAGFEPERVFNGNGPLSLEKLDGAVKVTTQADPWWPGYVIAFPHELRDLSDYGGVAMDIHNPETFAQGIGFRVDNAGADGAKHCNTEGYTLAPDESRTITVYFGFTDRKPGFPLDPKAVTGVCLFWGQPKQTGSLVVRNIRAIPEDPKMPGLAKPREQLVIDFKDETLFNLRGGAIVDGRLVGDTMPEAKQWFEYWESRAGLLAGSFSYSVKFQYRVLDADEGATFYSLFRSLGKGWGKWDRGWTNIEQLPAKKGQILTQEHTVDLPRFKDYFMMFGVNGRAKVEVLRVEITRGAPYNDGDLLERAVAKRNANAEQLIMVDFEDALPATARIAIGDITEAAGEALMGRRSLVVDTIGRGQEWNEAFTVGRGRLDAGYKYFVTVPVRMEKKGPKGGSVYIAAQTPDGQKIGWRSWNSGVGEDDVMSTTFHFREDKAYELLIGIQNEARVIFDEIEIRREPLPPDRVPLLKVRDSKYMKLVFEDTFDGPVVDETKWKFNADRPHRGGMIRKANAVIEDGNLHLLFKPEGDTFSMPFLDTSGLHEFAFGYFECRMMLPKQEGHWPAFWLFNSAVNAVGNDGRDGTEVDIMEAPWRDKDQINHALHWDGYGDDHASEGIVANVPGINQGWHTFAVDWQPEGYIFLINGVETWRTDAGGVCQKPLFMILSEEMGGWSGNPWNVDKALLPDRTIIDYVRVWQ